MNRDSKLMHDLLKYVRHKIGIFDRTWKTYQYKELG